MINVKLKRRNVNKDALTRLFQSFNQEQILLRYKLKARKDLLNKSSLIPSKVADILRNAIPHKDHNKSADSIQTSSKWGKARKELICPSIRLPLHKSMELKGMSIRKTEEGSFKKEYKTTLNRVTIFSKLNTPPKLYSSVSVNTAYS